MATRHQNSTSLSALHVVYHKFPPCQPNSDPVETKLWYPFKTCANLTP